MVKKLLLYHQLFGIHENNELFNSSKQMIHKYTYIKTKSNEGFGFQNLCD
jgi:hypothetical protein